MRNLQELPKLKDSISYLYIEYASLEKSDSSICISRKNEKIQIPLANVTVLMLGPGTSITHAAVQAITDCGCMIVWCGENASKFYAYGHGETRSAKNLLTQAEYCMDDQMHMDVVRKMYQMRFPDLDTSEMTLQQVRGLEGNRVRSIYKKISEETGIEWNGRSYRSTDWSASDPVNKALSLANSFLYGICSSAIISLGYSTGLGFIHTGKQLSFVYDIADLYKAETTIPVAFYSVKNGTDSFPELRKTCHEAFYQKDILGRIAKDISSLFENQVEDDSRNMKEVGNLWDFDHTSSVGGVNYSEHTKDDSNCNE